ncbi:MAG TPA: VOC family protein [Acidimicrobiales bacterium]|nr:VOC family protein [Acidimicrobiales bacterium]
MAIRIQNVSIDCLDPARLAAFWAEALGWRITSVETEEVVLEPPAGSRGDGIAPDIVFLLVPDDRVAKNRVHLDLRPSDQFAEVQRLIGLGARHVDVGQSSDSTWVVLGDPEGNEFCVLRPFTEEELATL